MIKEEFILILKRLTEYKKLEEGLATQRRGVSSVTVVNKIYYIYSLLFFVQVR